MLSERTGSIILVDSKGAPLKTESQPLPDENEIGVLPIGSPYGGFSAEEEIDLRDVGVRDFDKMCRQDGTARALYNILTLPIRGAGWAIQPAEGGDDEAGFIRALFTEPPYRGGMSTPMNYVISVAAKAIRQGFVLWEKVYRIGSIRYIGKDGNAVERDNMVLLRKLAHRPSDQITFLTDDHGGLNGAIQRVSYKGTYQINRFPAEKIVVYTVNKHENALYGESAFLPAYYHYDKKHKLYYVAHLAYLVNAIPPRIGKYPSNIKKELQTAFKKALANLGLNAVVTLPEFPGGDASTQYKVETFESRRPLADFTPMINHHNAEMAKSVLAQFLDLGQHGNGGAYALGSDQSDLFIMSLEAFMREIEYTINSFVIPELIDWNFGTGKYPEFRFDAMTDDTRAMMKDAFSKLVAAASKQVSDEFMLELEKKVSDELGLEIDYDAIEKRMQAQQELDAQAKVEQTKRAIEDAKNPPPPTPQPGPKAPGAQLSERGRAIREALIELRGDITTELDAELAEWDRIIAEREANRSGGD